LLFADHGLSTGAISSLFVIWSVTSFILEVPSGAWADLVDRRLLLVASAPIYAAGFATWILWPGYAGFAAGFVMWGLSSALMSGAFEALLYDELAARRATDAYAGLLGHANAAGTAAALVATALAGPLYAWGGYAAVAWASVAVALVHGVLAWSLPAAPKVEHVDETSRYDGGTHLAQRYLDMLRHGVREAIRHAPVRRLVVIGASLVGLTAYDEYFGLVAVEAGATTDQVPLLVALAIAGQLAGTALAGRTASLTPRAMTAMVVCAGVLIAAGALAGHPLGFVALAAGYGLTENVAVVADAKLQDAIAGPARATITSVSGLSSEIVALAIYVGVAAGSAWLTVSTLLALATLPMVGIAAAVRSWWPDPAGSVSSCARSAGTDRVRTSP
jgi:MFS family permease